MSKEILVYFVTPNFEFSVEVFQTFKGRNYDYELLRNDNYLVTIFENNGEKVGSGIYGGGVIYQWENEQPVKDYVETYITNYANVNEPAVEDYKG